MRAAQAGGSRGMRRGPGAALLAACALLLACTPRFDWRVTRSAEDGYAAAFPGPPRSEQRDIDFGGRAIRMSMTSAGVEATMFAVGVAHLPADAVDGPAAIERTLGWFRDRLVRNLGAEQTSEAPLAPDAKALASMRGGIAFFAHARDPAAAAKDVPTRLAARVLVADDRVYQLAVLWSDGPRAGLPQDALDTFFGSFRLAP